MRGVPLRIEIGPKDIEKSQVLTARRDTREKAGVPMDGLAARVRDILDDIQRNLLDRALTFRDEHTQRVESYDAFKQVLEGRPGFVIAPWCGSADCEAQIKTDTQATIRNMPMDRRRAVRHVRPLRQPGAGGSVVRQSLLNSTTECSTAARGIAQTLRGVAPSLRDLPDQLVAPGQPLPLHDGVKRAGQMPPPPIG